MIKSAVFPCYNTTTLLIDHCGMELLHLIEKPATNEGSSKVPEEFCFIFPELWKRLYISKATPIMIMRPITPNMTKRYRKVTSVSNVFLASSMMESSMRE